MQPILRSHQTYFQQMKINCKDTHQNSHVGTPSPRKKRNNSTPTQRKNIVEKKQILQQLISPNSNKVDIQFRLVAC